MQGLASQAYGQVQTRTADDRNIEYTVFQQITDAMEVAASAEPQSRSAIVAAVNRNNQLWTALAADLMHPDNALPDELKQNLLNIAEYVRRTGMKTISRQADIADLIDMNKTIMAGMKPAAA